MSWSGEVFFSYLLSYDFLRAAWTTLWVAAVSQTAGTILGAALALAIVAGGPMLRGCAGAYIWFWRGSPLLVQLFLLYFGLPQLGIRLDVITAGLLGLALNTAAFMAEIVRGAVLSIDRGQIEAARALGLGRWIALSRVIAPQALPRLLPPLGNEFNSKLRTTSLLSVISFEELLRVTTLAINETFRPVELYAVAACYYLALTTGWTVLQSLLERRFTGERRPSAPAVEPAITNPSTA
jgi:polar amino acid transport system permease protein